LIFGLDVFKQKLENLELIDKRVETYRLPFGEGFEIDGKDRKQSREIRSMWVELVGSLELLLAANTPDWTEEERRSFITSVKEELEAPKSHLYATMYGFPYRTALLVVESDYVG